MAKEITGLNATKLADGGGVRWSLLYQFPISPEVQDANAVKVVPQASADLVSSGALVRYSTDAAERNALVAAIDAGNVGFALTTLDQTAGETNTAFSARAKLHWTAVKDTLIQGWRDRYAKAGVQITAP